MPDKVNTPKQVQTTNKILAPFHRVKRRNRRRRSVHLQIVL